MITIDRSSRKPVSEQILEQVRFEIACGRIKVGETLPSTRAMAKQSGTSFHTVRKAYGQLVEEGMLHLAASGRYTVAGSSTLSKSERIERGAAAMSDLLQTLVSIGMDATEIEYLMQEQLDLLSERTAPERKIVLVAACEELAEIAAMEASAATRRSFEWAGESQAARYRDADTVFAAFPSVQAVLESSRGADVIGIGLNIGAPALERAARLLPHETLGLVTTDRDAIGPLTTLLREQSGFRGQIVATPISAAPAHLETIIGQVDCLLYTPQCRRRVRPYLQQSLPHAAISITIAPDSLTSILSVLPSR